jgi:WD40 repeat protein
MPSPSLESLFRIYNARGEALGAGFLVGERLGLTCWHVAQAVLPGAEIGAALSLDFPCLPAHNRIAAKIVFLDPAVDMAGLELDADLPAESRPVALVEADELWNHPFRAFGFPRGYPEGVWAAGRILERNANGWLQIENSPESSYAVQPGFSGGAIWDEALNGVVGMVVAADTGAGVRAAFILPVATLAGAWPEIQKRVTPLLSSNALAPTPGDPPYMGLRYFDTTDAGLFYGREALSRELAARLADERFLAVVGASGSGKSSLARAGLIPLWEQGLETPSGRLSGPVHVITPGVHPLESLAASLTRESESVTATATLMDDLAKDPRSLRLYARKLASRSNATERLLLVDQFEETFTLCKDLAERRAFIENLIQAAADESSPGLRIVITLRADFYHACAEYESLRQALEKHQAYIGAMTATELRQAIEAPALAGGWQFQPGLIDLILRDAGDEPGALPLLAHALLETWRRRQGRTLTLAGYAAAGGVRKAIAHTAESVYARLAPAEQAIARGIFLRLTELGEGVQDTRRRVPLAELALAPEQQAGVDAVLQILTGARLVTTARDSAEVAHEALIREWPTLRRWLDEDREGLRLQRHLTESAREWDRRGRDPGDLYSGSRLAQAQDWAASHVGQLNPLEQQFLEASLQAVRQAELEREARQQRELAQAQKLAQTQRQRSVMLGVGLAMALLLAGLALWFYSQSQSNLRVAVARQLAAQAQFVYETYNAKRMLAVLLAVQSERISPSFEANQVLQKNTQARSVARMTHDSAVNSVAFSPDGRYVVSGSWDETVRVWEVTSGRETARMTHDDGVISVAFSPDGWYVVSGSWDNTARVWEAASGREIARMTHDGNVTSAAFSADGRYVVSGSGDNTARVWEVASGREIARMTHDNYVNSVAFSPDGRYVVSGSRDKTVRVWEVASGKEIARMTQCCDMNYVILNTDVNSVAFSPDGRYVVSGGGDGTARVWETTSGREIARMTHVNNVNSVAFSSDGRYVVSGSWSGLVLVWEAASGKEIARMLHDGNVSVVAFSPDGRYVASGSDDNTARLWEAASGKEIARMIHNGEVNSIAFSPDGMYVASGSDDTIQVWGAYARGMEITSTSMPTQGIVNSGAFSQGGQYMVLVSRSGNNGIVLVREATSGKEIARMAHDGKVYSLAISPDGRYVVAASEDKAVRVWDVASGREIARMPHDNYVYSVAFNPDGRYVVSGSEDGIVRIWDTALGTEIARMTHDSYVSSVAFSLDSRYVVSGSRDNTARVWEAASGREIARITHDGVVNSVIFSPDGHYVISGSDDKTSRVWEAASGREIARMTHDDSVWAGTFSLFRREALSGSRDKIIRVWLWHPEDLIADACARLPRNLTRAEWNQYVGDTLPYQAVCPNLALEP